MIGVVPETGQSEADPELDLTSGAGRFAGMWSGCCWWCCCRWWWIEWCGWCTKSGGLVLISTSTRLLVLLLMGLKELTDADKSPLAAAYRPPFIVPKRLLLACICIDDCFLQYCTITKQVIGTSSVSSSLLTWSMAITSARTSVFLCNASDTW